MTLTTDDSKRADISKIHSEINQILNQRYNLIAVTITIFGFFLVALTQKDKYKLEVPFVSNVFVIAFFFLTILITLNYLTRILTRQFYLLRTYLRYKKYSEWESDYAKFRDYEKDKMKISSFGYSESQRFLYVLMGLLIILISFIDQFLGQEFEPTSLKIWIGPVIYFLTTILYYFSITSITAKLLKKFDDEVLIQRWNDFLNSTDNNQPKCNDNKHKPDFTTTHFEMQYYYCIFQGCERK